MHVQWNDHNLSHTIHQAWWSSCGSYQDIGSMSCNVNDFRSVNRPQTSFLHPSCVSIVDISWMCSSLLEAQSSQTREESTGLQAFAATAVQQSHANRNVLLDQVPVLQPVQLRLSEGSQLPSWNLQLSWEKSACLSETILVFQALSCFQSEICPSYMSKRCDTIESYWRQWEGWSAHMPPMIGHR